MKVEEIKPYQEDGDKARQVEEMFDSIAPAYDFMNRAMTLGIDRWWRHVAVKMVGKTRPRRILDVATGTGDFAIALYNNLKPQQVYLILKSLSQRHILHFIPQKKTPYIRYTQRREDKEHIQLMPDVYEKRKQQYIERIHAMVNYADCDHICRSRYLLRYFGEDNDHDCRQCDVCLSHRPQGIVSEPSFNTAMEQIITLRSLDSINLLVKQGNLISLKF